MTTLDAIARPSGAFSMVAMDQRESLRHMFDLAGRGRPADEVLIDFKVAVAEELGPLRIGLPRRPAVRLRPRPRRRLPAVDAGSSSRSTRSTRRPAAPWRTPLSTSRRSPRSPRVSMALKLLLIWRRDERRPARVALAARFIEVARQNGVLSVLEPVVRAARRRGGNSIRMPRSARPRANCRPCAPTSTRRRCRGPARATRPSSERRVPS